MSTYTHTEAPTTHHSDFLCTFTFYCEIFSYFFPPLILFVCHIVLPKSSGFRWKLTWMYQAPWNFKTFLFLYFLAKMFSSSSCDCDAACCCCYGCYDCRWCWYAVLMSHARDISWHGMAYYGIIKWALRCRSVLTRDTYPEPSSTVTRERSSKWNDKCFVEEWWLRRIPLIAVPGW